MAAGALSRMSRNRPEPNGEIVHITVDEQSCVGAGQCVLSVPDVFDQDEMTGRVVLLEGRPPADLEDDVVEATRACPAQAITVTDD